MTGNEINTMLETAFADAATATQKYLDDFPGDWFPCGFAWVNIKPARGPVVARLKALDSGYTDSYYGGYTVYNPSKNATQCMEAKKAGATAFAKVLRVNGVVCSVGTRMD